MHRTLAILTFLVLLAPVPALPQSADLSDVDRDAIRAVIEDQLAAFQADDAVRAFSHASPTIRQIFGTPSNFMQMVVTGYPPVYRPRAVEFEDIVTFQGAPTQRVLLVGPDGRSVVALYVMEKQAGGDWKINGCYLIKADESLV